jgi:uncharacterized repeat protein (TIGR03803 family)
VDFMQLARILAGVAIAACLTVPVGSQTYTESVLYSFCPSGLCPNGSGPEVGVIQGNDGNFYGMNLYGPGGNCGGEGCGTVFKITPEGVLTTLYTFCTQANCTDGYGPVMMVQGGDGNLYGVTAEGGNVDSSGVIFRLTLAGKYSVLYAFCSQLNCPDGNGPFSIVQGADGNFYGTASEGGANGKGTIFKITPAGAFTNLYSVCSVGGTACTDGSEISRGLLQGSDGNFYGTMSSGGKNGMGTFFRLTPAGVLTTLYNFCSVGGVNCSDGSGPTGLVQGSDGNFYGSAGGGSDRSGVIFNITPAGELTVITTGASAYPFLLASDGNVYGTTDQGGPNYGGTVFQVTPSGMETTIYTFCSLALCFDGDILFDAVMQGADGNFFGTTVSGGVNNGPDGCDESPNCGTVFEIAVTPALPSPVQLSLSSNSIALGASVEITYKVLNAFSLSAQQCYGFSTLNGVTTAVGKVPGTLVGGIYGGSANVTFPAAGVYHLALTCGGVESGFATLTVNGLASTSTLAASPNPATVGQTVTLSTTVTGSHATPTGTVTFYYGSQALGSVALNSSGVANLKASSTGLPAGTYAIHSVYSGNATYSASTSPTVSVKLEAASQIAALPARP